MNRNFSSSVTRTIIYIIFALIAFTVIYPLVYVVSGAFSPGNSMASMSIVPFTKQNPDGTYKLAVTAEHFVHLFTRTDYGHWFMNTLIIAVETCVLTVLISCLTAYVFSRFNFKFKKPFLMSLLILQIFPSFIGMIAIYVILLRIGGLDTLWGLTLVYTAGNIPYNAWLVKNYMDTVSKNLDEAARIDGASHLRIFFTIIMPVIRPIVSFLTITSFIGPWMDFIFPKMVLRSPEKQTLALGLFAFVSDKKNEFTNFAAGALIVSVPFVIFFLMTQKTLITSFGGGAVKE